MARFRLCKSCGELHQVGRWPHNCLPAAWPRSDLSAPYVISDQLGGINGAFHHGALKRFDSKSEFRKATRDLGFVEVGNERRQDEARVHVNSSDREIEAAVAETIQYMEQKGMIADEPV